MPLIVDNIEITEANRFSEYALPDDIEGRNILLKWRNWFTEHGVPSTLALTYRGYAVYREGLLPTD